MTTISASEQATHEGLYAEDRHCVNMGGECSRRAVVDVRLDMSGRELTVRLCGQHARRIAARGLRNATIVAVTAIAGA
jgi:hypothetical protein